MKNVRLSFAFILLFATSIYGCSQGASSDKDNVTNETDESAQNNDGDAEVVNEQDLCKPEWELDESGYMTMSLEGSEFLRSTIYQMYEDAPGCYVRRNALMFGASFTLDLYLKIFRDLGYFNKETAYYLSDNYIVYGISITDGTVAEGKKDREMQENIINELEKERNCEMIGYCDITKDNALKIFDSGGIISTCMHLDDDILTIIIENEYPEDMEPYVKERPHYKCRLGLSMKFDPDAKTWDLKWIPCSIRGSYRNFD